MQIVAIFGAPRSGTSWLGQLFNSSPQVIYRYQPLFSYSFKGRLNKQSSRQEIAAFYRELIATENEFVTQTKNISGRSEIHFEKSTPTHLVWKEVRYHYIIENLLNNSDTKIIGIVRHPCAVINSWLKAPKEFKQEWDPLTEWRWAPRKNNERPEEYNGYEKWKELAFLYMQLRKKYPDRFHFILYEELNDHTPKILKNIFDFCTLPWSQYTEDFIVISKNTASDDPYGVFRLNKDIDSWNRELPVDIISAILGDPAFVELNKFYQWNI